MGYRTLFLAALSATLLHAEKPAAKTAAAAPAPIIALRRLSNGCRGAERGMASCGLAPCIALTACSMRCTSVSFAFSLECARSIAWN